MCSIKNAAAEEPSQRVVYANSSSLTAGEVNFSHDLACGGYWDSSQLILRRILGFEPADPSIDILRRILGFEPADPGFETIYCGGQACVDSGVELVSGCLFFGCCCFGC